jgi:hypothetical protein
MMAIKKESVGQRGKTAQDLTQAHLTKLNNRFIGFAFERVKDARAARGGATKALCDFLCWYKESPAHYGINMPLEVKSTEHDYRLPYASLSQLPSLNKVYKAGALPYVLVLFKGLEKWRIAPIHYFSYGVKSWDMRDLPLFDSAEDALNSTNIFPIWTPPQAPKQD